MISFASGTLPSAVSAVVACHLTMCRACTDDFRRLEIVGGLALDWIKADLDNRVSTERAFARLLNKQARDKSPLRQAGFPDRPLLPPLLTRGLGLRNDEISWKLIAAGVSQYQIRLPNGSGQMRLLRLTPGESFSRERRNQKVELILVLQGTLRDDTRHYVRGDVIEWAEDADGSLQATADVECVCLVAEDAKAVNFTAPYRSLSELRQRVLPVSSQSVWQGPAALAASLALIIGIALGWLFREGPDNSAVANFVTIEGGRIIAQDALRNILDALPSGKEQTASLDSQQLRVGVRMTFQDQTSDYCRQYQISTLSSERYSGIACREGENWVVRLQALLPPVPAASQRTIPSAGNANAAMDAVIGSWMSGNPLVGAAEAELINKKWRQ